MLFFVDAGPIFVGDIYWHRFLRRGASLAAGDPFDLLVSLLAAGKYEAAAIEGPFSLAERYLRKLEHYQMLMTDHFHWVGR